MNVPAQLNYSQGYFARFPYTDDDIIAHLLEFPNIKAIKLVCLCLVADPGGPRGPWLHPAL